MKANSSSDAPEPGSLTPHLGAFQESRVSVSESVSEFEFEFVFEGVSESVSEFEFVFEGGVRQACW